MSLSAAGAAAGTAIFPGVGTAVGGILGAFGDMAMGGGGGSAGPAGPVISDVASRVYGSGLDGSGWAVNFRGIQTATSSQDKSMRETNGEGVSAPLLDSSGPGIPRTWLLAGAVVVGVLLWRKSKK